jgi:YozD-like protein
MVVKEIEVVIDTEEIVEFFYKQLIQRGYAPTEVEMDDLADITFEYLLEKCMIDEVFDDEDE